MGNVDGDHTERNKERKKEKKVFGFRKLLLFKSTQVMCDMLPFLKVRMIGFVSLYSCKMQVELDTLKHHFQLSWKGLCAEGLCGSKIHQG